MAGVNKVILVGRLGKDPEVRYTPDNRAIANITLATSESWKDKNTGQRQEKTEWHRVVFFGGVAGVVGEYVRKGSQIYIEGKLQTRNFHQPNPNFQQTQAPQQPAQQAPQQNFQQSAPQNQATPTQQPSPSNQPFEDEFDDDIPF